MEKKMKSNGFVAYTIVGLVIATVAGQIQLGAARNQLQESRMEAVNLKASLDTTRLVLLDEATGKRTYQRLSEQHEIERDALDRRLKQESAFRARVEVTLKRIEARIQADTVTRDGNVFTIPFIHDETPFHITGSTSVDTEAMSGHTDLAVSVDPITLGVRVGCQRSGAVNAATVNVSTPGWLTAKLDSVTSEPRVCNPPKVGMLRVVKPAA
jgi:hypothetical protein